MDHSAKQNLREYIRRLYDCCYFRLMARELEYHDNQSDRGLDPSQINDMHDWALASSLYLKLAENRFNEAATDILQIHPSNIPDKSKSEITDYLIDRIDTESLANALRLAGDLIEKAGNPDLSDRGVDKLAYKFIEHINKDVTVLFATSVPPIIEKHQVHYNMDQVPNPDDWTP